MIYRTFGALAVVLLTASLATAKPLQLTGPNGESSQPHAVITQYGPTQKTDTLWRIANRVRPDDEVSVYQVMAALYDANPGAFKTRNFNSLERNRILVVPSKAVMLQIPIEEARRRAKLEDINWDSTKEKSQPAKPSPQENSQLDELRAENLRLESELQQRSNVSEEELAALRAELANSVDKLAGMLEENEVLKQRLKSMGSDLLLLQSHLAEQEAVNQQLMRQLSEQPVAPSETVAESDMPEEQAPEPSFWQDLLKQPLLLTVLALVPAIAILFGFMMWLRRSKADVDVDEQEFNAGQSRQAETVPVFKATTESYENSNDNVDVNAVRLDEPADADGLSLEELLRQNELNEEETPSSGADTAASLNANQASSLDASPSSQADNENQSPVGESSDPSNNFLSDPILDAPEDHFIDIDKLLEESNEASTQPSVGASQGLPPSTITEVVDDEGTINAKLDLARAYIEIEDKDSARALLKEVTMDGNEHQQQEAEQLLKEL